jgi:hypothetical protein
LIKRLVDGEQFLGLVQDKLTRSQEDSGFVRDLPFSRGVPTGVIGEDIAHDVRGTRKEMRAILP